MGDGKSIRTVSAKTFGVCAKAESVYRNQRLDHGAALAAWWLMKWLLRVSWLLIAVVWLRFWMVDLHTARAADLLILVPAMAMASRGLGLGLEWGAIAAMTLLCGYFWERAAGAGCTGVSEVYMETLGVSLFLVLCLWLAKSFRRGTD